MNSLPKGIKRELVDANTLSGVSGDKADMANNKVNYIDRLISNDLKPKYEAINTGTVRGLENLTKIIQKAREDVRGAAQLAENAANSASRVRKQNDQLKLNLKNLRDKILLARQKASSIHIAVTANSKKPCFRSYKPVIEPSTTNSIVLNYAIETGEPDSLLFFLGSSYEEDFIAIEMFNRKIRFLWNVGGGTQVIQHNMTIETNNNQLLTNEQWYKIEVNRIGNIATLSVKRTPEGQKPDPYEVSGASPVGYIKMDLDSSSNLFVGGFPEGYLIPSELRSSSFAGCLYTLELNGKSIGLWNFLSSIGCDGCKEGATEDIDISAYEFQGGNSYAIVPQNPYYRKSDLYTVINFKTLNEDALLFLSCDPKSKDFISLELRKGKVVYQLKFGSWSKIYLETKKRYNTGKWIRVEAAREKFEAQILVEDELLEKKNSVHGSSTLNLQDSPLFYGGVPPNFTKESWPGITFKSFFGCLKDLQMDSTPIALSRGSYYGMSLGCSTRALKSCVFGGAGYLELNSHSLSSDSSFSFSFLTYQKNALLVLSTFSGKESSKEEYKPQNYFSLSLKEGRIEVRIGSDLDEISMVSDSSLSTGVFHTVSVIRKKRRLLLQVDDVEEAEIRLPHGTKDIIAPHKGGLFFGGVNEDIPVSSMAASQDSFVGIIQDVIFNNRLLRFEEAIRYAGVDFGFSDVTALSKEVMQQIAISHNEESCSYAGINIDENSFTPFHNQKVFTTLEIDKKDFLKSFNITFEFKTHYADGVLFFAKSVIKKQELFMFIKNNSLVVEIKRKNHHFFMHTKKLHLEAWNKVMLTKSQEVILYVNNELVASKDFSKKLVLDTPLYIGSAPKIYINFDHKSFYGCMKNVHINNMQRTPTSASPCFQNFELGSFFSGKGHVMYDSSFYLSNEFIVKLDFRASKPTGDLLYILSKETNMLFSLKLTHNQVLATLCFEQDVGKVELSQKFSLHDEKCATMWHAVTLYYKKGSFSLQVDNRKPIDKTLKEAFPSLKYVEIFFGGMSNNNWNTSSKYYVGCIRNIFINNEILDLRNSEDNQTVEHHCPSN